MLSQQELVAEATRIAAARATPQMTPEDKDELLENYYAWEWGDALFVVLDPFGNTVLYSYERVEVNGFIDAVPQTISYTFNAAAALEPHARVDFVYEPLEYCGGTPSTSSPCQPSSSAMICDCVCTSHGT